MACSTPGKAFAAMVLLPCDAGMHCASIRVLLPLVSQTTLQLGPCPARCAPAATSEPSSMHPATLHAPAAHSAGFRSAATPHGRCWAGVAPWSTNAPCSSTAASLAPQHRAAQRTARCRSNKQAFQPGSMINTRSMCAWATLCKRRAAEYCWNT